MARQSSGITLFLNSLICLGSLLRSLHGRQIRSPSSKPRTLIFHRLDRRMPLRSPIEDHGYFSWLHRRTAYDSQKSLPRSQHQSQFGGHGRGGHGDVGSLGRAQGWTASKCRKQIHHREDWSRRTRMFVAAPFLVKEATCQRIKLFRYVNMTYITFTEPK
jgi:hypothetical protein